MNIKISEIEYWLGVDIGSTTLKVVILNPYTKDIVYSKYERHNAKQAETLLGFIEEIKDIYKNCTFKVAVCGSGGKSIADYSGMHFVQEVVANAIVIREKYSYVNTAIELGGQDAKIIFFQRDEKSGKSTVSDMRMNGVCAGGTGAFIDQVSELLDVKTESFGKLAESGKNIYEISGRCGVFAKTDIQPLINQGVSKEDIALSTCYAVVKQTIGGLAQGAELKPPVIFEGGPLTFNKRLIDAFIEKMGIKPNEAVIPKRADIIVALGAALSLGTLFRDKDTKFRLEEIHQKILNYIEAQNNINEEKSEKLFVNTQDRISFEKRHTILTTKSKGKNEKEMKCYLGIDAGSTTSKFVLIDEEGDVIDKFYANNAGEPILVVKNGLLEMFKKYQKMGIELKIKGCGTTGYGEMLFSKAFKSDYHNVETVAHAEAAFKYAPGVSFILDIGGQDMKAIKIKNKVITGITLNEACSAGCGSFLETYAKSLKISVEDIANMAYNSESPSKLGSRCTVFMNSSIITEQRNGKTLEDIMAGLCNSIIENVFTKVVRVGNIEELGDTIVAQGGTFKNSAVLRALEKYTGKRVIRPEHTGEMGAIGIALLTKKYIEEKEQNEIEYNTSFIGFENISTLKYENITGNICNFCQNNCNRAIVKFEEGNSYVTGNRCEKGEIIEDIKSESAKEKLQNIIKKQQQTGDMIRVRNELLFSEYKPDRRIYGSGIKIGIPRVLEFWNSFPFWNVFFTELGFDVEISDKSSYEIFDSGLKCVPSDTVCFPAKIVHGHINNLIEKRVDRIFMPMMIEVLPEKKGLEECINMCALIQGYPIVIKENDEPEKHGIPVDNPVFRWFEEELRNKQIMTYMREKFGMARKKVLEAIKEADKAINSFKRTMKEEGAKLINEIEKDGKIGIIIAGRPYHNDELLNHNISSYFVKQGIPVLTLDSLPDFDEMDYSKIRADIVNPFHTQLFSAAVYAAKHPNMEMVQIVSFGCGHDAVNTDEIVRVMQDISKKEPLILKLDESEAKGPLNIRIKSFIETILEKRKREKNLVREQSQAFQTIFDKKDVKERTIFVPNISDAFSIACAGVLKREGYKAEILPIADDLAKALGKKYVHNDICYPAQLNIGEMIAYLERGGCTPEKAALGLAKNCDNCRAGQYSMLARKALDDAGYSQVSIITTGKDTKNIHPGFKLGMKFQLGMLFGLAVIDAFEEMRRKLRPYEIERGKSDEVFHKYVKKLAKVLETSNINTLKILEEAIEEFNKVKVDKMVEKPKVFIIGEILVNYHPTANENIVEYFEKNGMEIILPSFIDFFRRDLLEIKDGVKRDQVKNPIVSKFMADITDVVYGNVLAMVDRRMKKFRYYEKKKDLYGLADNIADFIDKSYTIGEGWLIPAEIIEYAGKGVKSFVVIQPFGCLPNHITGRGLIKSLKSKFPNIRIVSIDYDPDTSFANIENRLQMLIMGANDSLEEVIELELESIVLEHSEEIGVAVKN